MDYRFFRLNSGGVVDTAQVLRLRSDDDALLHARVFGNGNSVEVWLQNRKIATVPPGGMHV